jgi:hypothetical protein
MLHDSFAFAILSNGDWLQPLLGLLETSRTRSIQSKVSQVCFVKNGL